MFFAHLHSTLRGSAVQVSEEPLRGKVVKPGRNLIICTGEAVAVENGESKTVAIMQATMMVMKS